MSQAGRQRDHVDDASFASGSEHNIGARPGQIIAKPACMLKWFETHRQKNADKDARP
jgi:hypothetical protein